MKNMFTAEQVASFVRTLMKVVGGYVGVEAFVSGDVWAGFAGAVAVAVGAGWSMYKHWGEKKE